MNDAAIRASRLLQSVRRRFAAVVSPALTGLFDELERRLFDLAERCRSPSQQHTYFDGLRECRRKRADIEHDFVERIEAALRAPDGGSVLAVPRTELSLVASDDLEETLALSALAIRAQTQHEAAIAALEQRLAWLTASAPQPTDRARLGPQALGRTFRAACQRLDVGIEVRLVAYALFGHHVLDALGPAYATLNHHLIEAGVLPRLARDRSQRRMPAKGQDPPGERRNAAGRDAEAARESEAPNPNAGTGSAPSGDAPIETQHMLDELRTLLFDAAHALTTASEAGPGDAANESVATIPADLFANALEQMRQFRDEPRLLKAKLIEATHQLGAQPLARIGSEQESMIDMLALVFDFVRHDPDLPQPLQPLIARLQVPFLIASLGDPELLHSADHPARLLLDDLGELAIGWCPGSDPENQLLDRIGQTVDMLLSERELERAAFDHAIRDLQTHLEVGRRRAELAEQRSVEAALGRERLLIARRRVAANLQRRLQRCSPLPWIRQLVRGPWANHLVLLWLRHGETGANFRAALEFVDELLWCDEHGPNCLDRTRLADAAQTLESDLRDGLSTVAYHDREIEQLALQMRGFIESLRSGETLPGYLFETDPTLASMDFGQTWIEPELEEQPDPGQVDARLVARMRSLSPGTWFEFAGSGERAKLSWSSPFTGLCLLVNRNGIKTGEASPERLATDISRGTTRVMENSPLLQRALSSLLGKARSQGVAALRSFA